MVLGAAYYTRERVKVVVTGRIERDELVTFEEPEGPATFQWVLAQA